MRGEVTVRIEALPENVLPSLERRGPGPRRGHGRSRRSRPRARPEPPRPPPGPPAARRGRPPAVAGPPDLALRDRQVGRRPRHTQPLRPPRRGDRRPQGGAARDALPEPARQAVVRRRGLHRHCSDSGASSAPSGSPRASTSGRPRSDRRRPRAQPRRVGRGVDLVVDGLGHRVGQPGQRLAAPRARPASPCRTPPSSFTSRFLRVSPRPGMPSSDRAWSCACPAARGGR